VLRTWKSFNTFSQCTDHCKVAHGLWKPYTENALADSTATTVADENPNSSENSVGASPLTNCLKRCQVLRTWKSFNTFSQCTDHCKVAHGLWKPYTENALADSTMMKIKFSEHSVSASALTKCLKRCQGFRTWKTFNLFSQCTDSCKVAHGLWKPYTENALADSTATDENPNSSEDSVAASPLTNCLKRCQVLRTWKSFNTFSQCTDGCKVAHGLWKPYTENALADLTASEDVEVQQKLALHPDEQNLASIFSSDAENTSDLSISREGEPSSEGDVKVITDVDHDSKCKSGYHSVTTSISEGHYKQVKICVKGPVSCGNNHKKRIYKKCEGSECKWFAQCIRAKM